MVAELPQGHDVQDLVERAQSARQDDERIGLAVSSSLRSNMVAVTRSSVRSRLPTSRSSRRCGMMPRTGPPTARPSGR